MGVKINILYSTFLTLSNYVFGFLVYPYVTRVLGVDNFGKVDFVINVVVFVTLFASFGISMFGIREVAKARNNKESLNNCFSSLLLLNIVYTILTLILYFIGIVCVERLSDLKLLFIIGSLHVISSAFLIEWLYRGLEDFKTITIRNLVVKVIYVVGVFLLVKDKGDYVVYYILTISITVLNALVNFYSARRLVRFSLRHVSFKKYIKNSVSFGSYTILTSMYTTFNVIFLGFVSNNEQVGLYAVALKLYTIILSLYTAFTSVMLPRGTSLVVEQKIEEFNGLLNKSFEALYTISFPIIIVCVIWSSEIVSIIAGKEYYGSALLMQIIMPLVFVVGLAQIFAYQILIPFSKDKKILQASIIGSLVGLTLNILLVQKLGSVGTSIVLVCTECSVTLFYLIEILKIKNIKIDIFALLKHVVCCLPYIVICLFFKQVESHAYLNIIIGLMCCLMYFIISQLFIVKNSLLKK